VRFRARCGRRIPTELETVLPSPSARSPSPARAALIPGLWVALDSSSRTGSALGGDAAHVIILSPGRASTWACATSRRSPGGSDAARLGLDPGDATVAGSANHAAALRQLSMGVSTDGLNRLFSNRSDVLRWYRVGPRRHRDRPAAARACSLPRRPQALKPATWPNRLRGEGCERLERRGDVTIASYKCLQHALQNLASTQGVPCVATSTIPSHYLLPGLCRSRAFAAFAHAHSCQPPAAGGRCNEPQRGYAAGFNEKPRARRSAR